MTTTTTACPGSYDELVGWYRPWVISLVKKAGIDPQDAEDVAQDILEAEFRQGVLEMYNPEHEVTYQGKTRKVTFRAFLSSRVMLRCRGKRQTLQVRAQREILAVNSAQEGSQEWLDLFGGYWDDYSELDAREFIDRMRAFLATVPRRSAHDVCDLLALFDELVAQVHDTGEVSSAAVQRRFGIADTTAAAWLKRLRETMSGAGELPAPEKHAIGGVTLTLADIAGAIRILREAKGNKVKEPLHAAGHVLDTAAAGWYHPFSKEEIKLFPELNIDPQTHEKPADRVKNAVIHRLERMLGVGMAESPAPSESVVSVSSVPAQAAGQPGSIVPAEQEPDLSPLDLIEARIWALGADRTAVDEILALCEALRSVPIPA